MDERSEVVRFIEPLPDRALFGPGHDCDAFSQIGLRRMVRGLLRMALIGQR